MNNFEKEGIILIGDPPPPVLGVFELDNNIDVNKEKEDNEEGIILISDPPPPIPSFVFEIKKEEKDGNTSA
jgi:hypothetical protein